MADTMRIGEVVERTGLSVTTIRHYDSAGLVVPSARSAGGFRLYTPGDVERLLVIKRMKPLGFRLDEMRQLLETLTALEELPDGPEREELLARLELFHAAALAQVERLRGQLEMAQEYAGRLRQRLGPAPASLG